MGTQRMHTVLVEKTFCKTFIWVTQRPLLRDRNRLHGKCKDVDRNGVQMPILVVFRQMAST